MIASATKPTKAPKPTKAKKDSKPPNATDTAKDAKPDKQAHPVKGKPEPTKEELERKHYQAIIEMRQRVAEAEEEFLEANIEAQGKKKNWEARRKEFFRLIARGPNRQLELPLQDSVDATGKDAKKEDGKKPDAKLDAKPDSKQAEDNSWRDVPIKEVIPDLTKNEIEKFEGLGVKTMGQFEDLRAGKLDLYPRGLLSVKGIGEAKITRFENAVVDWWSKRKPVSAC